MSIEELSAVVKPPTNPIEVGGAREWNDVERKIGVELPHDYSTLQLAMAPCMAPNTPNADSLEREPCPPPTSL